jgi:hypothetical protein
MEVMIGLARADYEKLVNDLRLDLSHMDFSIARGNSFIVGGMKNPSRCA